MSLVNTAVDVDLREAFFWFPSARPFVSRERKLVVFFERAIFLPVLNGRYASLRFQVVFTETKKCLPYDIVHKRFSSDR